jgi:acyl carrier protein
MTTTSFDSTSLADVTAVIRRAARIPAHVDIHAESHLVDDLKIDSLDYLAVILQLQDHFDVVIEDDAVPNLCRVGDLAAYLLARSKSVAS